VYLAFAFPSLALTTVNEFKYVWRSDGWNDSVTYFAPQLQEELPHPAEAKLTGMSYMRIAVSLQRRIGKTGTHSIHGGRVSYLSANCSSVRMVAGV
jgi:hypothetical protein